jgi:hypothetical protein
VIKGKSKGKSQKAKVKSTSGASYGPEGVMLKPASGVISSRMAASKLVSMLEALKDEKRRLESAISAIETAKRKRKAGPEPPISVN